MHATVIEKCRSKSVGDDNQISYKDGYSSVFGGTWVNNGNSHKPLLYALSIFIDEYLGQRIKRNKLGQGKLNLYFLTQHHTYLTVT